MWGYVLEFLRSNLVGLLFAVLGLGYLFGKTNIRGFEIGSITGVLFVGLVFGHFGFEVNPTVQSIGFGETRDRHAFLGLDGLQKSSRSVEQ